MIFFHHLLFASLTLPESALGKALFGSVALGASCGLLGCFVILRRIALMGDAMSHAVLPGVVAGLLLSSERNPLVIFLCALGAGLLATLLTRALQSTTRFKNDVTLGIVLASFFSFGIFWQSRNQQETVGVMQFIFGNVASLDARDLSIMLMSSGVLIALLLGLKRPLLLMSFDAGFAKGLGYPVRVLEGLFYFLLTFCVIVSLQAVGVVLVSAMLIIPAATAYLLTDRFGKMLFLSTCFGIGAALLGTLVSSRISAMPTGPVITLSAILLFGFVYFFAPRHGLISRQMKRLWQRKTVRLENTLKALYHIAESEQFTHQRFALFDLANRQKRTEESCLGDLRALRKKGLVYLEEKGQWISPSAKGWRRALELVRNHRLWELYLANEANYRTDHVHRDAEKIEHVLGLHIVRQLERELDFPSLDPHGKPIPQLHSSVS